MGTSKDVGATPQGETIFVFISDENGAARIRQGWDPIEVINGGWVCSPIRARSVDHLVAVGADGRVMYAKRAAFASEEKQIRKKREVTLVWFDLTSAPEMAFMVGLPSPVTQVRNPVAYAATDWVLHGDAAVEVSADATRAVVAGYVLDVGKDGTAYVTAPEGGRVVVECR
ncbi:hypothetical protein ACWFRF_28930 [Nocardia sp. NPDC055165]